MSPDNPIAVTDPHRLAQIQGVQAAARVPPPCLEFAAVYAGELSWVWRALWRLGVPESDLEDAAHDVFVVVHRKLADYDPSRPLRPWLFGICFRVALDRRRRAHVTRELGGDVDDCASDRPDALRVVEQNEARALVEEGLRNLPLEQRAVFVLHELEGLSIPACAEVLDAPLNTLYSRLRLARVAFATAVTRARRRTP